MSRTRRNNGSEVLRTTKPYKRKKHSQLLKEFEANYIAINQDPAIQL